MPGPHQTRVFHRLFTVLLITLLGSWLGGCASGQQQSGDFNALFAQKKYTAAYDSAAKVANAHGTNRDQASLVAGLSARSLDRNDDAKRWLTPLSSAADPNIAGQASAALGSIAQIEHRDRDAVTLFTNAGNKLKGDDAAHAFMCAGDSLRVTGKPVEAKAMYEKAKGLVQNDSQLRVDIGDRLNGAAPGGSVSPPSAVGKYTVQTGAFASIAKAKTEAQKYAKKGATRAVPIKNRNGQTLYAVQVGRFATKADAEKLRKTLGSQAMVTLAD